jgi:hypothetical protein
MELLKLMKVKILILQQDLEHFFVPILQKDLRLRSCKTKGNKWNFFRFFFSKFEILKSPFFFPIFIIILAEIMEQFDNIVLTISKTWPKKRKKLANLF